jgi:hypothetical protein
MYIRAIILTAFVILIGIVAAILEYNSAAKVKRLQTELEPANEQNHVDLSKVTVTDISTNKNKIITVVPDTKFSDKATTTYKIDKNANNWRKLHGLSMKRKVIR